MYVRRRLTKRDTTSSSFLGFVKQKIKPTDNKTHSFPIILPTTLSLSETKSKKRTLLQRLENVGLEVKNQADNQLTNNVC